MAVRSLACRTASTKGAATEQPTIRAARLMVAHVLLASPARLQVGHKGVCHLAAALEHEGALCIGEIEREETNANQTQAAGLLVAQQMKRQP